MDCMHCPKTVFCNPIFTEAKFWLGSATKTGGLAEDTLWIPGKMFKKLKPKKSMPRKISSIAWNFFVLFLKYQL